MSQHLQTNGRLRWLLTPLEAAEWLAVSPRTLWGLTKSTAIPCVRIGRCVRYDPDDLRAWAENQKQATEQHH